MIYGKFSRNPRATKKPVEQFGFVDVVKIMQTNSLPNVDVDGADAYNGIDDPASILGKPTDIFDAMAIQSSINDYSPDNGNNEVKEPVG